MKVVKDPKALLVTHALGSCIGVCIWDQALKIGGLLHYMLPDSRQSNERAQNRPYMYADVAIPLLFKQAYALGAIKKSLTVKLVGGAQVMNAADMFNIGKKNFLAARKILFKNNVMIAASEVGGTTHRTVHFNVGTGEILVKVKGGEVFGL